MEEMTIEEFRRKYAGQAARSGRRGGRKKDVVGTLLFQLRAAGLPEPEREYRFDPVRRWRFDLCWQPEMTACEIEGGMWMQTSTGRGKGHAHPKRFEKDCEKYSMAAIAGWRVIRVTPEMVEDGRALAWLEQALGKG